MTTRPQTGRKLPDLVRNLFRDYHFEDLGSPMTSTS